MRGRFFIAAGEPALTLVAELRRTVRTAFFGASAPGADIGDAGFVDTLRIFTQGNGHYSWWSHFANSRARNIGWRIDYVLVSAALRNSVKAAAIHADVMGSDHCPVSVTLD